MIFCNLGFICWEMIDWRLFNSGEKKSIITKKITFVFDHKFRHFPDLPVLRDSLCIEPKWLPKTYKKMSIATKCFFGQNSSWVGWDPPKIFSTVGPSDASRKKTNEFHLMQAIVFYSPCFCLSDLVWHEQIVSCTIVRDPNNFKCHGTIFAIFDTKKRTTFLSELTKT